MSSYILFLCGGKWQLPWVKFLKNKGHKILLVDPYDHSPCVELADVFLKEDVKNTQKIIEFIQKNRFQIEIVTSEQTDVSTLPISIISEALGIPANPLEVVKRFANKAVSRAFLKANFTDCYPDFKLITNLDELAGFISKNHEIILKPVDSQSSRGIQILNRSNTIDEVKVAYESCISFSEEKKVIAEQFIHGKEITLEGICLNNEHCTISGSNKKHFRTGIASDLSYPLTINSKLREDLFFFHDNLIKKTGLINAITHAEYIISDDEQSFYLVEMACRGGGSLIPSHIVPKVTNINIYELFYNEILNNNIQNKIEIINNNCVTLHFFEFTSGMVKAINGIDTCKDLSFVTDIGLDFKPGDIIRNAKDDRSRQGYVIVSGESKNDVSDKIKLIYDIISISYESTF
jgi:biotin carboxylase